MNLREKSPLLQRIARTVSRRLFRWAENNDDPRVTHNGEAWLLRELLSAHAAKKSKRPFVVFDAGANMGEYTRLVLQTARSTGGAVEVHAFEPSPRCVDALRTEFGAAAGVRIVGAALSDRIGQAALHDGEAGSSQASLVVREGQGPDATAAVTVPLIRLCDYAKSQAIERIDLLKLDVEGSELAALRGLDDRLRPEVIDAIQFEYGGTTIDAGATLRDFYRLLTMRGYLIAKLFPGSLELRGYQPWMEHYAYANYVALAPRWRTARRAVP